MITEEQIQEALNNPQVEEGKIIKGTSMGVFALLEASGCNSYSLEQHSNGYFFFGFSVPEKVLDDESAIIDTHHFKEKIKTLVSKNFSGEVNENTQVGLLKTRNEAGILEAVPCITVGTNKLKTVQSGRLRH